MDWVDEAVQFLRHRRFDEVLDPQEREMLDSLLGSKIEDALAVLNTYVALEGFERAWPLALAYMILLPEKRRREAFLRTLDARGPFFKLLVKIGYKIGHL